MQRISSLYYIFIFVLFCLSSRAQKPDLRLERLTDRNGRSLGFTTGVVQDSTGFIWISSRKGLFRYDGYSYTLFKNDPSDPNSLPFRNFTSIYYDKTGKIWLKHFNQFAAFSNEKSCSHCSLITSKEFDFETKIIQDIHGNYWVGPTEKGLYKFNIKENNTEIFKKSPSEYHPEVFNKLAEIRKKGKALAELVNIPSKRDTSAKFTIRENKTYLILSIGEASEFKNYDYGSIIKETKILWQSSPQKAKYAGGSEKNKVQIDFVELKAGNYHLNFKTDNSNAFNDWKEGETPDKIDVYGISIFEIDTKTIKEIKQILSKRYAPPNAILSNHFNDMALDASGNLLIASGKGFDIFDPTKNQFKHIDVNFKEKLNLFSEKDLVIQKILIDNKTVWLATNRFGLIKHKIIENETTVYNNGQGDLLTSNSIYSLHKDTKGRFWIGTDKGLNLYIPKENAFYKYSSNVKNRLYDNLILDITEDKAGNIWFATPEGLNKLKPSQFRYYDLQTNGHSLPVHIDKRIAANHLWYNDGHSPNINCYDRNLNIVDKYELNIDYFSYNKETGDRWFLFSDIIEDSENSLWLAIDDGLYHFDRSKGKVVDSVEIPPLEIIQTQTDEYDISDLDKGVADNILYIKDGKNNNLWLFSIRGVHEFNKKQRQIVNFYSFNIRLEYLYNVNYDFIKEVFEDKLNNFWIRTEKGIYNFNIQTKKLKLIYPFPIEIIGTSATDGNIIQNHDDKICFAVLPKLYFYDFLKNELQEFSIGENLDIGNSRIFIDSDSTYWIYSDNGLFSFSAQYHNFRRYTVEDGLADNQINGMLDDENGNLWITSSRGLTKYDKEKESFEIASLDFEHTNFIGLSEERRQSKGEVILFTDKGFYSFFPDSINTVKPPIALTKLALRGNEHFFDSVIYNIKEITLNWDQNFFSFEFAALDFTEPTKNQYKYMLEGLDGDWISVDASERKASYTGVSPKKYVFKVIASNNNKIWNKEGVRLEINITPPFWKTPWFYAIEAIAIFLLIYLFIKWRERNLRHEKRILEEKVTERTIEIERQKEEIKAQRDLATRQRDQIADQKQAIMDSIHYARRIQKAVLPPEEQIKNVLPKHFILNKPRDVVSGDFYWMSSRGSQTIITAADCTGHGVPGAFMSMLGVAFLNEIVSKNESICANEILDSLKNHVIKSLHQTGKEGESKDGMDIALCVIDHKEMKIQFAGAYNPLYLIRNGELIQIKADRMPIGIFYVDKKSFTNHLIEVQPNDTLYMFSDGYADQFSGKTGRKYMSKRFKQLLLSVQDKSMDEQKEILDKEINEWMTGTEQIDDILVIGIKI